MYKISQTLLYNKKKKTNLANGLLFPNSTENRTVTYTHKKTLWLVQPGQWSSLKENIK